MRRLLIYISLFCTLTTQAQNPWTALPTTTDTKMRFVVLGDRTGGERRGAFERAIPAVNALHPNFVISVGDVVDGYTTDPTYLDHQWQEFEKHRKTLTAPYIYVPGNHDISNPFQEADWQRRYGTSYYHFRVGSNVFFVLNTDDGGSAGIEQTQVDYFLKAIKSLSATENLFIVMHRPLWKEVAGSGKMGYEAIEKALKGHRLTLFSGHEHYYLKRTINGNDHYMLATTGGGSALRGESLGEFDHFLVVDVTQEGVIVRNILADGREISTNVVTEVEESIVKALRSEEWLTILPSVTTKNHPTELEARLVLRNDATLPMAVRGALPHIGGARFSPSDINHTVAAGATDTLRIDLCAAHGIDIDALPHLALNLQASYRTPNGVVSAPTQQRWHVDYHRTVGYTQLTIDNHTPNYIREDWDWSGDQDGGFTFSLFSDNNYLYIDINATDDQLITNPQSLIAPQDRFMILLDTIQITIYSNDRVVANGIEGILAQTELHDNGYRIRVAIPNHQFKGKSVRLNIGFIDQDNLTNAKPSQLYWQPQHTELGIIKIN